LLIQEQRELHNKFEVRLGYIIRLWIEGGGAETQRDYSVGKVLSVQA